MFATYQNFKIQKIYFSHPRSKSLEGGCIEYVMAEPRRLRLLPSTNLASAGAKDVVISVPDDSLGTRVARYAIPSWDISVVPLAMTRAI